jgi:hypothetical protein
MVTGKTREITVSIFNEITAKEEKHRYCIICCEEKRVGFIIEKLDRKGPFIYLPKIHSVPTPLNEFRGVKVEDFVCSKCFSRFTEKQVYQIIDRALEGFNLQVTYLKYSDWRYD